MRLTVGIDRDLASFQAARGLDGHATFVHATVLLRKFLDDQTLFRDRKPNVGVFCFFFYAEKFPFFSQSYTDPREGSTNTRWRVKDNRDENKRQVERDAKGRRKRERKRKERGKLDESRPNELTVDGDGDFSIHESSQRNDGRPTNVKTLIIQVHVFDVQSLFVHTVFVICCSERGGVIERGV